MGEHEGEELETEIQGKTGKEYKRNTGMNQVPCMAGIEALTN